MHLSTHDDHDGDGDGEVDDGGDGVGFTLDFNLGTIQRRQDIQTRLIAATLNLKKKQTRADNGR